MAHFPKLDVAALNGATDKLDSKCFNILVFLRCYTAMTYNGPSPFERLIGSHCFLPLQMIIIKGKSHPSSVGRAADS